MNQAEVRRSEQFPPVRELDARSGQYERASDVLAQSLPDALVLFHPGTERLLTLNKLGARIWELLGEGRNSAQILERLADEYVGPTALIHQEALEFLQQLEREQLIRPKE